MNVVRSILFSVAAVAAAGPALAQTGMQMPMPARPSQPAHDMSQMAMMSNPLGLDHTRDGSGTSWLPDASPMQGLMKQQGQWMLMFHANGFLQYVKTGGERGDDQFGSVNWAMGMAQRTAGGGQLQFRAMLSAEPLTVGRCGYPLLLQSGESCRGVALHDQQHPHDLFMELAASYRRAISQTTAFEIYGGLAGEPALGPTAFPHRLSAMSDPAAPIGHHWLDSTHIAFGVATAGIYGKKWKAEGSMFNGREPDDTRYDLDLATMNSYSGRVWLLPNPSWSLQVSAGHLAEAESGTDVDRVTSSATHHRLVNNRLWATTLAWGLNREDDRSSSAFLVETAADLTPRDTVFARGEIVGKTSHDLMLPFHSDEVFNVSRVQAGYTRWLGESHGFKAGLGGHAALAFVPESLSATYGGRASGELSIFLNVRTR